MRKFIGTIAAFAAALTLCGCASTEIKDLVTFHVATSINLQSTAAREKIKMPSTGFELVSTIEPFMYNKDLVRVDVAQVELPQGGTVKGFYFTADDRGTRRLFSASATNLNNFIVVKLNGKPIALRQVDVIISDGKLFAIADVPEDTDLQKTADDINEAILQSHELD